MDDIITEKEDTFIEDEMKIAEYGLKYGLLGDNKKKEYWISPSQLTDRIQRNFKIIVFNQRIFQSLKKKYPFTKSITMKLRWIKNSEKKMDAKKLQELREKKRKNSEGFVKILKDTRMVPIVLCKDCPENNKKMRIYFFLTGKGVLRNLQKCPTHQKYSLAINRMTIADGSKKRSVWFPVAVVKQVFSPTWKRSLTNFENEIKGSFPDYDGGKFKSWIKDSLEMIANCLKLWKTVITSTNLKIFEERSTFHQGLHRSQKFPKPHITITVFPYWNRGRGRSLFCPQKITDYDKNIGNEDLDTLYCAFPSFYFPYKSKMKKLAGKPKMNKVTSRYITGRFNVSIDQNFSQEVSDVVTESFERYGTLKKIYKNFNLEFDHRDYNQIIMWEYMCEKVNVKSFIMFCSVFLSFVHKIGFQKK